MNIWEIAANAQIQPVHINWLIDNATWKFSTSLMWEAWVSPKDNEVWSDKIWSSQKVQNELAWIETWLTAANKLLTWWKEQYTLSNVTLNRTFDATSTDLEWIANTLSTLLQDLQNRGVINN